MQTEEHFKNRILEDALILLRPATVSDLEALYAVASDPLIWEQHNAHDRWKEEVFRQFFVDGMANEQGMHLVIEKKSGAVIGGTRFYNDDPAQKEIRIGYTFFDRTYWGKGINGRVKRLMLDHAFQKVNTVYFDVYVKNFRSQQALKKLGAQMVDRKNDKMVFALNRKAWE